MREESNVVPRTEDKERRESVRGKLGYFQEAIQRSIKEKRIDEDLDIDNT